MAEIPVERKKSKAWIWIVLAIVIAALLIWWIASSNDDDTPMPETSSAAVAPAAVPYEDTAQQSTEAAIAAPTIAAILENPSQYIGRDDFAGEVDSPETPTDRGFWVEQNGQRMFAVIVDEPRDAYKDINPGQRLRITNGMIRDASAIGNIPGNGLDADTKKIIQEQPAFLVVDEEDIEILQRPIWN